ncbi:MAG: hypothetical protein HYX87_07180 [Chloroflexi bacterium]|nr:hypothetical protein [Chloroflexota bacterium]
MNRQEVLNEIDEAMGLVPEWMEKMPDPELEHFWGMQKWFLGDSGLTVRDKALVAFGAASATHCPY